MDKINAEIIRVVILNVLVQMNLSMKNAEGSATMGVAQWLEGKEGLQFWLRRLNPKLSTHNAMGIPLLLLVLTQLISVRM